MAYQYVANEVMKTPIAKNLTIVMAMRKQFLANYLLESPSTGEGHHFTSSSMAVDSWGNPKSSICLHNVSRSSRG